VHWTEASTFLIGGSPIDASFGAGRALRLLTHIWVQQNLGVIDFFEGDGNDPLMHSSPTRNEIAVNYIIAMKEEIGAVREKIFRIVVPKDQSFNLLFLQLACPKASSRRCQYEPRDHNCDMPNHRDSRYFSGRTISSQVSVYVERPHTSFFNLNFCAACWRVITPAAVQQLLFSAQHGQLMISART
jgi:hypothetical protein